MALTCGHVPITSLVDEGCNAILPRHHIEIKDGVLYRDGSKFANVTSIDEETGEFKGTMISSNFYLRGKEITGTIEMPKAQLMGLGPFEEYRDENDIICTRKRQ